MILCVTGSSLALRAPIGGGPPIASSGATESSPRPLAPKRNQSASMYSKFNANWIRSTSVGYTAMGMIGGAGSHLGLTLERLKGKQEKKKKKARRKKVRTPRKLYMEEMKLVLKRCLPHLIPGLDVFTYIYYFFIR
ncbi:hypothetical protein IHE45_07G034700 [Dioscorea alata]|uniref:Uncharacterized protein n=1 Tax=Dioscorea alata TaxID=55571 RepID=A0ACB7VQ31_DIOAL|nr:hypothetical protein IHE45_07G034700 [Dioscorea alata]